MKRESTTAYDQAQLPPLRKLEFGSLDMVGEHLFCIREGQSIVDGLALAAELADGVHQLGNRLAAEINNGEIAYLSEVRSLAFLAEVAGTITRAAQFSLKTGGVE